MRPGSAGAGKEETVMADVQKILELFGPAGIRRRRGKKKPPYHFFIR
jgi:hypothetical protein